MAYAFLFQTAFRPRGLPPQLAVYDCVQDKKGETWDHTIRKAKKRLQTDMDGPGVETEPVQPQKALKAATIDGIKDVLGYALVSNTCAAPCECNQTCQKETKPNYTRMRHFQN